MRLVSVLSWFTAAVTLLTVACSPPPPPGGPGTDAAADSGHADSGKDSGHPGADAATADAGGITADSGQDGATAEDADQDGGTSQGNDAAEDAAEAGDDAADDAVVYDAAPIGPGGPTCASATDVTFHADSVNLWSSTDGGTTTITPACATGVTSETFFKFTFDSKVIVYADTFGSTADTVLFLASSGCAPITTPTMTGDTICSDNACGTPQSQIVALLTTGEYFLGVGTTGAGSVVVHLQYVIAPSGTENPLPQGSSQQKGTTDGNTGSNTGGGCLAAGPENGYFWTSCPTDPGGELMANTCGGTTWESAIETEIPELIPAYACSVDACYPGTSFTQTIPAGAGLRMLLIDGENAGSGGSYTMEVTRP